MASVITLRSGDEVTIYDTTTDGLLSLIKKNPSENATLLYHVRVDWRHPPMDRYTDLSSALNVCNQMNNNRWHISEINKKRYIKGLRTFPEKTIFFVSIEWNELCSGYIIKKQVQEKKLDLHEILRKTTVPLSKKRGRPKGSKNKPKTRKTQNAQSAPIIKRKRGRPKGSKNKIKH